MEPCHEINTVQVRNRFIGLLGLRVIAVLFFSPGKLLRDLEYKTGEYPKGLFLDLPQIKNTLPTESFCPHVARSLVQQGEFPSCTSEVPTLHFLTILLPFVCSRALHWSL